LTTVNSKAAFREPRDCPFFVNEMEATMRPTTAEDNVFDFNALLYPGAFEHSKDAVHHTGLTTVAGDTRVLDIRCNCHSCPALHALPSGTQPVSIDEILEALCDLDGGPRTPPGGKPYRLRSIERAIAA
jgi:hypothetical protein